MERARLARLSLVFIVLAFIVGAWALFGSEAEAQSSGVASSSPCRYGGDCRVRNLTVTGTLNSTGAETGLPFIEWHKDGGVFNAQVGGDLTLTRARGQSIRAETADAGFSSVRIHDGLYVTWIESNDSIHTTATVIANQQVSSDVFQALNNGPFNGGSLAITGATVSTINGHLNAKDAGWNMLTFTGDLRAQAPRAQSLWLETADAGFSYAVAKRWYVEGGGANDYWDFGNSSIRTPGNLTVTGTAQVNGAVTLVAGQGAGQTVTIDTNGSVKANGARSQNMDFAIGDAGFSALSVGGPTNRNAFRVGTDGTTTIGGTLRESAAGQVTIQGGGADLGGTIAVCVGNTTTLTQTTAKLFQVSDQNSCSAGEKFSITQPGHVQMDGLITNYGNVATEGTGVSPIREFNQITGNTSDAVAVVQLVTSVASDAYYEVGGHYDVTAYTSGNVGVEVVYTDCDGTAVTHQMMGNTSTATWAGVRTSTGATELATIGLCINASSTITLRTELTGTATMSAGGWIRHIGP